MDKKAQGLSLNTIIIAIIVMIVLVVIIMVFTGFFGSSVTPGLKKCENNGGTCTTPVDEGSPCGYDAFSTEIPTLNANCNVQGQVCCSKGLGVGTEKKTCGLMGQTCDWDTQDCVAGKCVVKISTSPSGSKSPDKSTPASPPSPPTRVI